MLLRYIVQTFVCGYWDAKERLVSRESAKACGKLSNDCRKCGWQDYDCMMKSCPIYVANSPYWNVIKQHREAIMASNRAHKKRDEIRAMLRRGQRKTVEVKVSNYSPYTR